MSNGDGEPQGVAGQNSTQQTATRPPQGIRPPPVLTSMEEWKTWLQMWKNYSLIAGIKNHRKDYQVAMFLHSIGIKALEN